MGKIQNYKEKYNEIAKALLEYFHKNKGGENVVLSPYSVIILLGIAATATNSKTREEILKAVFPDMDIEEVKAFIADLQQCLSYSSILSSSNAVCVRNDFATTINEEYVKELENIFSGELFSSEDIVSDVNSWVREHTNGMIDGILEKFNADRLMCLINAITFQAEWDELYEDDFVNEGEFRNIDGTKSDVMMLESDESLFVNDNVFKGFVKQYKRKRFSFMGLLPRDENVKLDSAIKNIDFTKLFNEVERKKVYVKIPEFCQDTSEDLSSFCKELGIRDVFMDHADFSCLSSANLRADQVLHKAHIEVDRNGTKAAAVTVMDICFGSAPCVDEYEEVYLDRPFIYAIMNNKTGLPVFVGVTSKIA